MTGNASLNTPRSASHKSRDAVFIRRIYPRRKGFRVSETAVFPNRRRGLAKREFLILEGDEVTGGVHEYVFIIYEQRLSASTGPASLSTGRHPGEEGNRITYYVFIFFSPRARPVIKGAPPRTSMIYWRCYVELIRWDQLITEAPFGISWARSSFTRLHPLFIIFLYFLAGYLATARSSLSHVSRDTHVTSHRNATSIIADCKY